MRLDEEQRGRNASSAPYATGSPHATVAEPQILVEGPILAAAGHPDVASAGKLDLAVANDASNTVSVLLGNGNGTFGAATSFTVGNPVSLTVGDFNGDGNLDLAVTHRGSDTVDNA